MPELRIIIPDELEQKISAAQPEYLDRKGFVCLVLDSALDNAVKMLVSPIAGNRNGVNSTLPLQFPPDLEVTNPPPSTEAVKAVPSSKGLETSCTTTVGNRKKIRAKRAKGCDSFETFWTTYQSLPIDLKARGQSKAKALDVWSQLVPDEVSAEELQTAVKRLADAAIEANASGEYFTTQPDCFRWLRDDSYSSWLEQNETSTDLGGSFL